MVILAIADRQPSESILETLKKYPVDIICTLGDLDFASLHELRDVTTIPKIGVYGNHCSGTYFEGLGIKNMHLKTFEFNGLVFGGFEGCVRYKSDIYAPMCTQEEAFERMRGFPQVDVMLSHCPPYGINDEQDDISHQGFKALRAYLEEKPPKFWLHGHTYPTKDSIVTAFCDTRIIYVTADQIVEI